MLVFQPFTDANECRRISHSKEKQIFVYSFGHRIYSSKCWKKWFAILPIFSSTYKYYVDLEIAGQIRKLINVLEVLVGD